MSEEPHPSEATGRALWRRRVEETPARPFLANEGRTWTYAEFDRDVRRLAAGLRRLGVGRETRVLVGMGNRPDTVQAQLALHELGAVSVPLLAGLTFSELEYPINHSGARFLLADEGVAPVVLPEVERCPGVERVLLAGGAEAPPGARAERLEALMAGPGEPPPHEPLDGYDDRSPAFILYTSGSTGRPKGVVLGAGSFYSCGDAFAER